MASRIESLERLVAQMLPTRIMVRDPEIERERRAGRACKLMCESPDILRRRDVRTVGSEPAPVGDRGRQRDSRQTAAERALNDRVPDAQTCNGVLILCHTALLLLQ